MIGKFFSQDKLKQIEQCVHEAEKKTSVEIVPFIIDQADYYSVAHYRCALLLGFISLFSCAWYRQFVLTHPEVPFLVGSFVGYLLPYFSPLKRMFLLSKEKNEEVYQKALETFYDLGLHRIPTQNGVLIFIALAEKKVRLLWDRKWNELHSDSAVIFKTLAFELGQDLKNGPSPHQAVMKTIQKIGALSEQRFPQSEDQKMNFISNTPQASKDRS